MSRPSPDGGARCRFLLALLAVVALGGGRAPAAATISPCDITGVERIVAIGDVHGAYDRLVELLKTTGLIDDKLKWAGGKTHLVQTGDVVDRGPDSRKALDLLHSLTDEASRQGGAVHMLLGNHEVMRMLGDLRFVTSGEYQAFVGVDSAKTLEDLVQRADAKDRDAIRKETPLGEIEMRLAFGRQGVYGTWVRALPAMVKINGIVFVHGGISPTVAALGCEAINKTIAQELDKDLDKTRQAPLASLVAREDGPLWYRGLAAQDSDALTAQVDDVLAKMKARTIVVAHTVVNDGRIHARLGGKLVQIDTGMQPLYVTAGRASALDIQNGVLAAVYGDRRDVLLGSQ